MGFGNKLLLTLLPIIILSIGAIAWISFAISKTAILDQQTQNMDQLAEKTMQTLGMWMEDLIKDSKIFSQTGVFRDACQNKRVEECWQRLVIYHNLAPQYESIFVALPSGKVIQDSLKGRLVGTDISKTPEYKTNMEKMRQGKTWVSQAAASPLSGNPVCLVTSPIHANNGTLVGIMGTSVEVGSFSNVFVSPIEIGQKGYLFLVDSEGCMVTHPDPKVAMKVNMNDLDFGRKMLQGRDGLLEYTLDGHDQIAFYHTDSRWGWMVAANADRDEFLASARRVRSYTLLLGILVVILVSLAIWLRARSITRPLEKTVANLNDIAQGRISDDVASANLSRGDEIGDLAHGLQQVITHQRERAEVAQAIAGGRLDVEVNQASQDDALGKAMQEMVSSLRRIIRTTNQAVEQVASGARQVSESSQALSQGAGAQAASLEQITSSMIQLSHQTVTNAENAGQANSLAHSARQSAETGNEQMSHMIEAMGGINQASTEIAKIIKTIDEIAFQTNLLALNAAVEAARAGKHGKGFAVVAQEVRNLARRSAEAAQETAELIEGTVNKVRNGTQTLDITGQYLSEIVNEINKVADLIDEITIASNEQAEGIRQINQGLAQIEKVTHQNSATSEQSASAADHLSYEAEELKKLMFQFKVSQN